MKIFMIVLMWFLPIPLPLKIVGTVVFSTGIAIDFMRTLLKVNREDEVKTTVNVFVGDENNG